MAIKTFTSGEVLTAADTNTYLGNAGLVYIKQQTVGTAVTSVSVSNAFSATYDNYKIIYEGGKSSASAIQLQLRLDGITANYYSSGMQQLATSATVVVTNYPNLSAWLIGYTGNQQMRFEIDLGNPNASGLGKLANTKYASYDNANSYSGTVGHQLITTSGATGLSFIPDSGTITGGTIYVYGYRKA